MHKLWRGVSDPGHGGLMSLFSQNKDGGLTSPSKPAAIRLLLFYLARMDEAIMQGLGHERSTINPVSSAPRGRTSTGVC